MPHSGPMAVLTVRWCMVVVAAVVVITMNTVKAEDAAAVPDECIGVADGNQELRSAVLDSDGCFKARIQRVTHTVNGSCEIKLGREDQVLCTKMYACKGPFDKPLYYYDSEGCNDAQTKLNDRPMEKFYFFGKFLADRQHRIALQNIFEATDQVTDKKIQDIFACGNVPTPQRRVA